MKMSEHLEQRHFDTDLHKVWIDEKERCATFPLWNLSGQMVGYQRYRPEGTKTKRRDWSSKYYPIITPEMFAIWGLESWHLSNTLFITEGVFNASHVTYYGHSAIAVLSCSLSAAQKNWLWTIRKTRPVVAICDNDDSGLMLARYGHEFHVVPEGDLGDASEEYVLNLLKEYD